MPLYTVRKILSLEVPVEAETAQQAYELQLEMDDNLFEVHECDYQVTNSNGDDVTDQVDFS